MGWLVPFDASLDCQGLEQGGPGGHIAATGHHQLVDTRVSPPRPIGGQANGANLECDSNTARGKIISEWTLQCPLNRESPLLFTISVHRTG